MNKIKKITKYRVREALVYTLLKIGFSRYLLEVLLGVSRQRVSQILNLAKRDIFLKYKIGDLKDCVKKDKITKKLEEIDRLSHREL